MNMIYLTVNDGPSGVFKSQVVDKVSKMVNGEGVSLVSLIPFRSFWRNRKLLKGMSSDILVIPMFPGLRLWKLNLIQVFFLLVVKRPKVVQGRNIMATFLALKCRGLGLVKTVYFDGRGACYEEMSEYKMVTGKKQLEDFYSVEKKCVLESDMRFSVSEALVRYWNKEFGYSSIPTKIVPCLPSSLFRFPLQEEKIEEARLSLGYSKESVVISFLSGGAAWQSAHLLKAFFEHQVGLGKKDLHLLILGKSNELTDYLIESYPENVRSFFVKPENVPSYLLAADFGFMVREKSITNLVSSPVKFGEYLACGLKILIGRDLGDYSDFVIKNDCGFIIDNVEKALSLTRPEFNEKNRLNKLSLKIG